MNKPDVTLDDVLNEYVAETGTPSYAALHTWMERFPEHAQALADFTAAWSVRMTLGAPEQVAAGTEAEAVARARASIAHLLRPVSATPITSLLSAAKGRGLQPRQLAAEVGLSDPLLRKLDLRRIRFASIPQALIERLATVLQQETAAIVAYLQGSQRLAAGASYRSEQTPTMGQDEEFVAAVQNDRSLTPAQRDALLALNQDA